MEIEEMDFLIIPLFHLLETICSQLMIYWSLFLFGFLF